MATTVSISEFLKLAEIHPVLDVRTPAEFEQGHMVGAINLPLFTNEERKIIGILYKQRGKQVAILEALAIVGPKLQSYVKQAISLSTTGTFLVHCWRGGMRSSSMAWFIETYGFKCITLKGGYKSYRRLVLEGFEERKNLVILGGKTGTGKTLVLQQLERLGEQILDLEKLAHHKGSSFGSLGELPQNSQEQFENELWHSLSKIDSTRRCWVENESRKIGRNILPIGLWLQMQNAFVVTIHLPKEERLKYLVDEYGNFDKEHLIAATSRIGKKLGGVQSKNAIEAIRAGNLILAFEICLFYYDKTYNFGQEQRENSKIIDIEFKELNPNKMAQHLIIKTS